MNLYEIDAAIMACIDEETGEILDQEMLDKLNMDRDAKIENIALWIKNLRAEAEAIKAEKQVFAARQAIAEKKAESLKNYLAGYLAGEKYKSAKVAVSWRKSETVEVDDVYKLPEEYLRYKELEVKKAELKNAMQLGFDFSEAGARLVQRQNIQIR